MQETFLLPLENNDVNFYLIVIALSDIIIMHLIHTIYNRTYLFYFCLLLTNIEYYFNIIIGIFIKILYRLP